VFLWVAWEPVFHKFMKVSSVSDDFMGAIMSDLQMTCHFINSQSSVIQNHGTHSFNILIRSGHGRSPQPFCISYTCDTSFELVNSIFKHTSLWSSTVPILHWKSSYVLGAFQKFCVWFYCNNTILHKNTIDIPDCIHICPLLNVITSTVHTLFPSTW
jgi:hypothetical protein